MLWKGVNVAITGATGFIGSWLVEELVNRGANVTVLVHDDCPIGIESITALSNSLNILHGDICEYEPVKRLIENQEVVFHLAALTQVMYSIKKPVKAFEVNAWGTLNVLEALRNNAGTAFLVHVSTDKVYGEPRYLPIDEEHPLLSKSPYDAAKLAAERLVYSYHATYGIRGTILRFSNNIGGRDSNFLRSVPDFITSILKGEQLVIRGDGTQVRDYLFVTDTIEGLLLAAEKQDYSNGEAFNLGTGKPTSVSELAATVLKLSGTSGASPIIRNKSMAGEISQQYLSSQKAATTLGWASKVGLEQGLKETIRWYEENPSWANVMKRVASYHTKMGYAQR